MVWMVHCKHKDLSGKVFKVVKFVRSEIVGRGLYGLYNFRDFKDSINFTDF